MKQLFHIYNIGNSIGAGHSCCVYLAKHKEEDKYFAIKEYSPIDIIGHENNELTQIFMNEVMFFEKIDKIIKIGQATDNDFKYFIRKKDNLIIYEQTKVIYILILQLARNGKLTDFVYENPELPKAIAQGYILQIAKAIRVMHALKYAHMDIKLDNILVDEYFILKLTDFGLVDNKDEAYDKNGTETYMAPEVQTGGKYNPLMADIFSLGCTFFEIRTGLTPFRNAKINLNNPYYVEFLQEPERFWANFEKYFEDRFQQKITIEASFKILIENMLNIAPFKRPTINQVLESYYMKEQQYTEGQIFEYMQKLFQQKGVYQLNSSVATGSGVSAILGVMEIEQIGLNQFRFKNIKNDKNFERCVKKFFNQIIAESSDMTFETNVTFEDIIKSTIVKSEQAGTKVTTNLIRNMENTCLLAVIMELILDELNLSIVGVKGIKQEQNKLKKIIRTQLKMKMTKIEQQII